MSPSQSQTSVDSANPATRATIENNSHKHVVFAQDANGQSAGATEDPTNATTDYLRFLIDFFKHLVLICDFYFPFK